MAGKSDDAQANRGALPFEPKSSRKKSKSADKQTQDTAGKKSENKKRDRKKASANKSRSSSTISQKAQARFDEIQEGKRKRAKRRAEFKEARQARRSEGGGIPEAVSQRMLKRMAILSLTPIALGVGVFFLSHYLLTNQIVEFPPVVVLLSTMGCFGLGVVGLTYGMLSASWDEEAGSLVGLSEFKLNFGRMVDAWRESRASNG